MPDSPENTIPEPPGKGDLTDKVIKANRALDEASEAGEESFPQKIDEASLAVQESQKVKDRTVEGRKN